MIGAYKNMIMTKRCTICNSPFGCSHVRFAWQDAAGITSSIDKKWDDENHLGAISLGENMTDITNPLAILDGIKRSEPKQVPVNKIMNSPLVKLPFIKCNFCPQEVDPVWLTRHIGMHIENRHLEETNVRVSDDVVRLTGPSRGSFQPVKEELTEVKQEDVRAFLNAIPFTKIKEEESFHFRKIKEVSAFSGKSKDGRYSDFSFIVWFSDLTSTTTYNAGYVGGSSSYYGKPSERLQIHLTYDSLERYFTISGRAYKRTGYSDFETEEGAIPDRICDQEELMVEIKRIFLFFKVSPKAAYKRFLKTVRKGIALVPSENSPAQAVTSNHLGILEDLKKTTKYTTKASESGEYPMYGC